MKKVYQPLLIMMLINVLGVLSHVTAATLSAQSTNLSVCLATLPQTDSVEERTRVCEVKRARSLLFVGNAGCPGSDSVVVPQGCNLEDSTAAGAIESGHIPNSGLAPITREEMRVVYAGYFFVFENDLYRINGLGKLQEWTHGGWRYRCTFDFIEAGCLYEQGTNYAGATTNYHAVRGNCNYTSLRFYPSLAHMNVTSTESRFSTRREFLPMFGNRYHYSCSKSSAETLVAWSRTAVGNSVGVIPQP